MVLEETLVFHNDIDAGQYIGFLKQKGGRTIRKMESYPHEETVLRGSICNLIAMLEEMIAANPEKYAASLAEEGLLQIQTMLLKFKARELPGDLEIPLILSNVKQTRDYIVEVMARFEVGEMIPAAQVPADFEPAEEVPLEQMSELDQALATINNIMIMEKNQLVMHTPTGCTLVKKMDPGEVVVAYRVVDPTPFTSQICGEHHLTMLTEVTLDTSVRVSTDSSLYFSSTFDEIYDVLADLEVEGESLDRFFWNFRYKSFAIQQILNLIGETGRISLPDIIEQTASLEMKGAEDDDDRLEPTLLHLTPAFITALIGDLRKATVVEGSDQKIRLVP